MKRYTLTILALCLALLLSACESAQPQPTFLTPETTGSTGTATEPTETTAATSPTTDPTVPSATEPSALDPALWYIVDPEHPSYEEFIAQNMTLSSYYSNKDWTVQHGDSLMVFEFDWLRRDGLLVIQKSVVNKKRRRLCGSGL